MPNPPRAPKKFRRTGPVRLATGRKPLNADGTPSARISCRCPKKLDRDLARFCRETVMNRTTAICAGVRSLIAAHAAVAGWKR